MENSGRKVNELPPENAFKNAYRKDLLDKRFRRNKPHISIYKIFIFCDQFTPKVILQTTTLEYYSVVFWTNCIGPPQISILNLNNEYVLDLSLKRKQTGTYILVLLDFSALQKIKIKILHIAC